MWCAGIPWFSLEKLVLERRRRSSPPKSVPITAMSVIQLCISACIDKNQVDKADMICSPVVLEC